MGTFGINRIYTVGRVVKVEDLMRFERFAPRGFDSLRISNANSSLSVESNTLPQKYLVYYKYKKILRQISFSTRGEKACGC